MMTECPRCGFAQPKDRYCANCGVDMDNYEPTPPPWFKKLLNSLPFQIFLAVWAVAATVYFIFQTQQQQFKKDFEIAQQLGQSKTVDSNLTTANTKGEANTPSRTKTKMTAGKTQNLKTGSATQSNDAEEDHELAQEYADYDFDKPATTTEDSTADEKDSTLKSISKGGLFESEETIKVVDAPTEVRVRFAEVSNRFLNTLAGQGEVLTDSGGFRVFSIAHQGPLSSLIDRNPGSSFLGGGQTQSISSAAIEISFMVNDDGEDNGMALQIKPSLKDDEVTINLESQLNLKYQDEGASNPSPVTGRFTFRSGRILIIAGLLPHEPLKPGLADALSGTPLAVMDSVEFKANTSELVILIQPQ